MRRYIPIALRLATCGLLLMLTAAKSPKTPKPTSPPEPEWKLIWADEFDSDRVDAKKWNIADRNVTNYDGGVNSYDPANVYLENDNLVIRSQCQNLDQQVFTSGRVTTRRKFSFLRGKVEVRAKLPGTQGMWPAIWMLPIDGSWPPEIDIMESLGNDPKRIYMTQHWGRRKQDLHSQTDFAGPDFSQDFHVFSIEWEPHQIRWLVDGVEKKVVAENIPSRPMYLILNTSVGGDWPGMPDQTTAFPATMQVDYVRVYQRARKR